MRTRLLGLISGSQNVAEVAEGVEFDGAKDYLSRSTDFTGNVDSKTFTFSAWVYIGEPLALGDRFIYASINGAITTAVRYNTSTKQIEIQFDQSSGATGLLVTYPINPLNTFINIQLSCDMANVASRKLAINDIVVNATWSTYIDAVIKFSNTSHYIMSNGASHLKGRLSHLFLDYTYRDLSIEANRRLFITADGKPADWNTTKALNGILMLQMKDAATAHINEGTGGNFTQNGTLDTAGRGANQDNCVASKFDGSADYLSRTSLTGVTDGKQFTLSFDKTNTSTSNVHPIAIYDDSSNVGLYCFTTGNGKMQFYGENSASSIIFTIETASSPAPFFNVVGTTHRISISIDMDSQANCKIYVDGVDRTSLFAFTTFTTGQTIDFTRANINIGKNVTTQYTVGNIGELYFDTKYIDLSTNNPFWDATENKPKPVRQVIRETGVTPLIAMPLDASNPGKNYGTGGDFTANSAPYVGARGASEFIARSAKFDGSTGYLSSTLNVGGGTKITAVFAINAAIDKSEYIFGTYPDSFKLLRSVSDDKLYVYVYDDTGIKINMHNNTTVISPNSWYVVMISIDTSSSSLTRFYINNINEAIVNSSFSSCTINSSSNTLVGSDWGSVGTYGFNGYIAMAYLLNDYIDFSQEVNRNKFVDQLGYPKDLKAQIDAGVIPKPLIYLPFDEPTNLGKNLGTGGNFTVNGTVTAGADVLG